MSWVWLREGAAGADAGAAVACRRFGRGGGPGFLGGRVGFRTSWRRRRGRRNRRQHLVVVCDRGRELLDQHAELVDLADHALHAVGAGRIGRHHLALDGREAAAELGDLAGEVGGTAGEVGDLAADIGAIAQPHRHRIVEDEEGQRGQRHQRGLVAADAGPGIEHEAEGSGDQHHADGDEDGGNTDHRSPIALTSGTPPSGKTRNASGNGMRSPKGRGNLSTIVDSWG